jgi:signal transduction histidine kinase
MSIRLKILISFLVVLLLTGGIATLIGRTLSRNTVESDIHDRLAATAQFRSQQIQSMIDRQTSYAGMLSSFSGSYSEVLGMTPNPTDPTTQFLIEKSPTLLLGLFQPNAGVRDAFFVDFNGTVISATSPTSIGLDVSKDELFQQGLKGSTYTGPTDFGGTTNGLSLGTSTPILFNGQIVGMIIVIGDEESLSKIVADTTGLGKSGEVYLLDDRGYVITPSRFIGSAILNQKVDLDAMATDTGMEVISRKNYLGSKVLSISQPIPSVGWTMVVEMGKSEAMEPVTDLTNKMLWGLLAALVAGTLLAILLSRNISGPILNLQNGAEEITKGNWAYEVKGASSNDEIGELSRAFALMTSRIRQSQEKLQKYNADLEYDVAKRTEELSAANAELQKARDELEIRVMARTQELNKTNSRLRQEVDDRRRAESEKERLALTLYEKKKELEQMIYVTSHDLRSPLVNIQGFSKELTHAFDEVRAVVKNGDVPSTVKEKLLIPMDEDIPHALKYIQSSASKIDILLSGLLNLSRVGRSELSMANLEMNDLMSEVTHVFEFDTRQAGAMIEVENLPPCRGDRARINQVFSNLISNALKYRDPGRPCRIMISGNKAGTEIIYCVADNGIGIAKENHQKIFEMFWRLDPSAAPGDGLGMSIVSKILDRHSGRIWVESELGKGSKFFVALPADV